MKVGRRLRRLFASVRVRVALVAGFAFALTLVGGAVLVLHTLESRLVDDIRDADEDVLRTQAMQFLSTGLPEPVLAPGTEPLPGRGTISFQLRSVDGRTIVATAIGTEATDVAFADAPNGPPVTVARGGDVGDAGPHDAAAASTAAAAGADAGAVLSDPTSAQAGDTAYFFDNLVGSGVAGSSQVTSIPIDGRTADLLGVAGQPGPFLTSRYQVTPALALTTTSSLAEVGRTLATTRTILWYAVPLLVLLVMAAAWFLVGRALRPVHALTAQAATITAESLHERVPVSEVGDEVSELATTINSMLSRIEASDRTSKRLVSDASHELRTPIAVMRTEIEVAQRDPDAEWSRVGDTLLGEVDRLQTLVDDLLLLARLGERGMSAERFSLLDAVRDVAARRRCTTVEVDDGEADVEIVGDSGAVQRALDHVTANAARHAVERVTVSVETGRDDALVAVHVDDDGPGIPVEDRERVLRRFERLDEARSRDAGGSGLGLAVANDVMRAHDGRVEIGESPMGGARVSLLLLRAP